MYGIGGERSLPEMRARPPRGPSRIAAGPDRQRRREADAARRVRPDPRGGVPVREGRRGADREQLDVPRRPRRHRVRTLAATPTRGSGRSATPRDTSCTRSSTAGSPSIGRCRSRGRSACRAPWSAGQEQTRCVAYLLEQAAPDGWFHQAVGTRSPTPSTLLVPATGLIASTILWWSRPSTRSSGRSARDGLVLPLPRRRRAGRRRRRVPALLVLAPRLPDPRRPPRRSRGAARPAPRATPTTWACSPRRSTRHRRGARQLPAGVHPHGAGPVLRAPIRREAGRDPRRAARLRGGRARPAEGRQRNTAAESVSALVLTHAPQNL